MIGGSAGPVGAVVGGTVGAVTGGIAGVLGTDQRPRSNIMSSSSTIDHFVIVNRFMSE
jgi:hypothetical protein